MRQAFKAVFFLLCALANDPAPAATLSVSPVSFDIEAPRQNAKLTLQNRGNDAVATQIRVFRWEKKNGADSLVPTKDVVASPPVAKLKPGAKYTVRIVRVAKRPVEAEESYRLLVDQLPKPVKRTGSQVSLLIRQSIPVFFSTGKSDRTPLAWSAGIKGGELVLTAHNGGARRVRLSKISVHSREYSSNGPGEGLVGWVLAGSASRWAQPTPKGLRSGSTITITAQDEHGPIEAAATIGVAE
jgi:fimbrial chaperone protein